MKWNFLWLILGGILDLRIIWIGYKYNGNPIFASYNLTWWIIAIILFVFAYVVYRYENPED